MNITFAEHVLLPQVHLRGHSLQASQFFFLVGLQKGGDVHWLLSSCWGERPAARTVIFYERMNASVLLSTLNSVDCFQGSLSWSDAD